MKLHLFRGLFISLLVSTTLFAAKAFAQAKVVEFRKSAVPDLSTGNFSGFAGRITARPFDDGSFVVAGQFTAMFSGVAYKNLVWLNPNGTLRIGLTEVPSNTSGADLMGVTTRGELVVAMRNRVFQPRARFEILSPTSAAKRTIEVVADAGSLLVGTTLAADGMLYFLAGKFASPSDVMLRRASLVDGAIDPNWSISVTQQVNNRTPEELISDAAGGLWLSLFVDGYGNPNYYESYRVQIDSPSAGLRKPSLRPGDIPLFASTDPTRFSTTYAYVGKSRFLLNADLTRDETWQPAKNVESVDSNYAYFVSPQGDARNPTSSLLERASVSGNGQLDASWTGTVPSYHFAPQPLKIQETLWLTSNSGFGEVYSDRLEPTAARRVIEFSYENGTRFFISGRADEIALLDSYPNLFTRTGVSFAAGTPVHAETGINTVCRFFVPEKPGQKASHFYGSGSECGLLNSRTGFAYEGIDFAVAKPVAGACAATSAVAVTRMFNNKGATGEGNHRYVTSPTVKQDMLNKGWVDEGVVFCANN